MNVQNWEPNIWNLDPATVQPLPLNKRYPPILEPQPKPYGPELPKNFVFKENVLVTGSPSKEIDIPTDEAKSPANSESENSCQPQPKPYVPELPKLDENKTAVAENVSEVINDVVVKDCSKTDSQEHEAEKAVPVVEGTSILIIETSEGDFSKISEVKVLPEEKQPESIKIPGETPVLKNISRGRKVQMDAMSQMSGKFHFLPDFLYFLTNMPFSKAITGSCCKCIDARIYKAGNLYHPKVWPYCKCLSMY